jgi:hypothetical protein
MRLVVPIAQSFGYATEAQRILRSGIGLNS